MYVFIEQLRERLNLNVDELDKLSERDLKNQVDQAISEVSLGINKRPSRRRRLRPWNVKQLFLFFFMSAARESYKNEGGTSKSTKDTDYGPGTIHPVFTR